MPQTAAQHKQKTISSLKWSGINQIFKQSLNIGIGIMLARLLSPTEFGLLGMVTVITGFMQLFNDFGFGAALIHKSDANETDYNSVFWFNLFTGFIFSGLLIIGSTFIAAFYHNPDLKIIIISISFLFIIQAFSYVQYTLIKKALNFKVLFFAELSAIIISGCTALYLAYNHYGVYSLIVQTLLNSAILGIIIWINSQWMPKFKFSIVAIKQLLKYSVPLMGSNALGYLLGNVDKILIGRFLGTASLGLYSRAYSLMIFPVGQISGVISQVMFPSLALIQNDKEKIKTIYLKMNQVISFVTFPLMALAFVLAEPFVMVVLGPQWKEMIPIFKILTIVGALQSVGTLVGNIFMALGETKLYLKVNFFSGIILILASIIGLQFGIIGVSIALLIATISIALPQWYLTGTLINLDLKKYTTAFGKNILQVVILVAVFLTPIIFNIQLSYQIQLVIFPLMAITIYAILSMIINKNLVENIIDTIKNKL